MQEHGEGAHGEGGDDRDEGEFGLGAQGCGRRHQVGASLEHQGGEHQGGERRGEVPGIHTIRYNSQYDEISITHDAHNRGGFDILNYCLTFEPVSLYTEYINIVEPGHSGFNFYGVDIRTPITTKEELRNQQ